jgi:hypothetical protein
VLKAPIYYGTVADTKVFLDPNFKRKILIRIPYWYGTGTAFKLKFIEENRIADQTHKG